MTRLKSANDNDHITHPYYLDLVRDISNGRYGALEILAEIYEKGAGVRRNKKKAVELYQRFYEAHRKHRVRVDEVELLMKIGHLHLELGNKLRAAEWYLQAGLQIVQDYRDEEERKRMFEKHKVEKFLKKTGCEEIV